MTTKHTPAPWIVSNMRVSACDYGWEGLEICHITGIDKKTGLTCNYNFEVNQANARLIAAAPKLLKALGITIQAHEAAYLDAEENGEKQTANILFTQLEFARAAMVEANGNHNPVSENKHVIKIEVKGGMVTEVSNLPDNCIYEINDQD